MKLTVIDAKSSMTACEAEPFNYFLSENHPGLLQYIGYSDKDSDHDYPYQFIIVETGKLVNYGSRFNITPVEIASVEVKKLK